MAATIKQRRIVIATLERLERTRAQFPADVDEEGDAIRAVLEELLEDDAADVRRAREARARKVSR